ncbi:MAG: cytochrome c oxidase accessory protein CcoG [Verrucomicrobiota bacterium]
MTPTTSKEKKTPNLISLGSIDDDGSKLILHPSDVRGPFTHWRRVAAGLLIAVYVALPWIPINGYPAVLFDLDERRFHFFGLTFVPADFWIGFFLLSGLGFGLFFATSLLGRVWCGWACPYTVFLEHIYRRIERFIDGDAPTRRKLDASPWSSSKTLKRFAKHSLYLIVSATLAHIFLSYFIPLPRLWEMMRGSPIENAKSFGVVLFFTSALYFSFAWFREQFCVILCPYGRIQSALTDDHTVIIGYDERRGEPRGKPSNPSNGDCIACKKCVQVCPTGIDIRNGLQLECIGCAACIDACNSVMTKLDRPKGLIRYDSMRGLSGESTNWIRPRIVLYTALALLGAGAFTFSLSKVHDVSISVLRMRGMPYYVTDDAVRNQFQIRLTTKRNVDTTFTIKIENAPPETIVAGLDAPIVIKPQQEELHPFTITIPRKNYTGPVAMTLVSTSQPGGTVLESNLKFQGPDPRLFQAKNSLARSSNIGLLIPDF